MTVSLNFRECAWAEETGYFPIALLTIAHPDISPSIRISTDPTERISETTSEIVYGTTSNGNDYLFFPCSLKLPDDTDDGPGTMQISFSNVTLDYITAIRSISGLPTVNTQIVMSNALNTVEVEWPEFVINHIQYDCNNVTCTMVMETLETEPFPAWMYTPTTAPNIFRGL